MEIITFIAAGTIVGLLFKLEHTLYNRKKEKTLSTESSSPLVSERPSSPASNPSPLKSKLKASESDSVTIIDKNNGLIIMDSLTQILGISSSIAAKLNEAGVLTYSELSKAQPEMIVKLLRPFSISLEQATEWAHQAKLLNNSSN